jgi:hypothetical protein
MRRKYEGFPPGFNPETGETPTPVKQAKVKQVKPRGTSGRRTPTQLRLRKSPPKSTLDALNKSAKKWVKGQSGNPRGALPVPRPKSVVEFQQFVLNCRRATPEVFDELIAAVRLPRKKEFWRHKLYACSELLSRAYGRAPQVVIDLPGEKAPPASIPMTQEYWDKFVGALRDSGALTTPVDPRVEQDVVDAEVVEEVEPPVSGE